MRPRPPAAPPTRRERLTPPHPRDGPTAAALSHRAARARRRSAVVGEVDQEEDENLDLSTITAPPLKTIHH